MFIFHLIFLCTDSYTHFMFILTVCNLRNNSLDLMKEFQPGIFMFANASPKCQPRASIGKFEHQISFNIKSVFSIVADIFLSKFDSKKDWNLMH